MSNDKLPAPESNGKCSRDCPMFYLEHMRGWPSAQSCFEWDDDLDGPEPYYLTDHICKPAIRLAAKSDSSS